MSRLVARILLSMFMFPMAVLLYIFVIACFETAAYRGRRTESAMFLTSDIVVWIGVATYWCLLWRSSIAWNRQRISYTFFSVLISMAIGAAVGTVAGNLMGGAGVASFGIFMGGVCAILIWLIATIFIWRESNDERMRRVASSSRGAITCPTCGYNLTGLNELRCPECGSEVAVQSAQLELTCSAISNPCET